ncbi:transcription intermediary factor 1-alpha-like [Ruditapes philippinarum]|uniref:transcription intermediary factor 1-alpha-like n=1 Tax=Ruditapes philippinarum TaxID=129788 RepID=UPI00295A8685|nr:transcription intermediary factor 1-alpha-like [Ruditapes philippinarum]
MEVSGKRVTKDKNAKLCSFCEDYDITTYADGFCVECEVNICNSCFVKHKERKNNRNHSLVKVDESKAIKVRVDDTNETCQEHNGEFVKIYCPNHDQVGCAECIIVYHNGCKLELIRDKAAAYDNSREFRNLRKEMNKCMTEAEYSLSLIERNRKQLTEFYEQFVSDVDAFTDHVIERINKMKKKVLNQAKDIMLNDKGKMEELQKDIDGLIAELTRQNIELESKSGTPNNLFVASQLIKRRLKKTQQNFENLRYKNHVTQYKFMQDEILTESVTENRVIGMLIEQSFKRSEHHLHEFKQANSAEEGHVPLPQPLLDRQLVCKNLNIDGECLSFTAYQSSGVGLYVFKENVRSGSFFEIEILSMGKSGSLAIGLVPDGYPDNLLPGLGHNSFGYHSDGKIHTGGNYGLKRGDAWTVGDRIQCTFAV